MFPGVRPLVIDDRSCPYCYQRVGCRALLLRHMRKHTGEKPYSCRICGYKACQSSPVFTHLRRHHGIEKGSAASRENVMYSGDTISTAGIRSKKDKNEDTKTSKSNV